MADVAGAACAKCGAVATGRYCGQCGTPTQLAHTASWQSRFVATGAQPWAVDKAYREVSTLWTLLSEPFRHLGQIPRKTRRAALVLAVMGVVPLAASVLTTDTPIAYWALALYFSLLWAGFFAVAYHSEGARPRIAVAMYFGTGIFSIALLLMVLQFGLDDARTPFLNSDNWVVALLGFIFGVGVPEELVKALPLFVLCRVAKLPPLRLFIYYGLISGLGFGFYEGINYQTDANTVTALSHLKANTSAADNVAALATYYLDNVLRLTSAPFFHAVWTGIAAFFIWFGMRFPVHRLGFFVLAIAIPAIYHGLYDGFLQIGQPAMTILVALLSAALLTVYVGTAENIERRMEFIVGERVAHPSAAAVPKA